MLKVFSLLLLPIIAMAQAPAAKPSMLEQFLPLILMFVIFYFLLIMPQRKQRKQHEEFLKNLKRGDEVLTSGGILGTVEGITEQYITLEVSDDTRIKILKSQIAGRPKEKAT